jgi:CDP-diacylglycerol--glycerol-3-phosphate 3-phosphatidyltransferase
VVACGPYLDRVAGVSRSISTPSHTLSPVSLSEVCRNPCRQLLLAALDQIPMTLIPAPARRGLDVVLEPIVRRLIAGQVSPNAITTVATLVLVLSAAAFGAGDVRTGGALFLLSGGLDMIDGKVARGGGKMTRFGAFYDSTLDRLGEAFTFSGIALYFLSGGVPSGWLTPAIVVTLVGLSAGFVVSYARARAEGLGLDCKVGIATRAERIVGLGAPTMFFGAGPDGLLLLTIVGLLAITSVVTVVQRMVHVYRATRDIELAPRARRVPAMVDMLEKGSQRG